MVQSSPPPEAQILAVYGTLAPGQPNHWVVQSFGGHWSKAWVRGIALQDQGYPVFIDDPHAPEFEVDVLKSSMIDWDALDAFEGENYRRILVRLRGGAESFTGNIYAWAKRTR
jgi:gamma-glutamylcyclotransferase (GGCT)/AIG2-like uncharacterized protein YtfP